MSKDLLIKNNNYNQIIEKIRGLSTEIKDIPNGWDVELVIRSLMNIFPWWGLMDNLIFANRDKKEIKQIINFLYIVSNQLDKLNKEKLDKQFLESDEAYVLFKKTLEKIKLEHRETKIHLLKNFLLKSTLLEEFAPREDIDKNYILSKIDELDTPHFLIIKWYFDNKYLKSEQLGSEYATKKEKELINISKYYKEFENDLMVNGLLEDDSGRLGGGHYYFPSDLCKVIYRFIKYDDN